MQTCKLAKLITDKTAGKGIDKRAHFGGTYTKIGTIQRRLAWPLRKDDTQIREAYHIFFLYSASSMRYWSIGR